MTPFIVFLAHWDNVETKCVRGVSHVPDGPMLIDYTYEERSGPLLLQDSMSCLLLIACGALCLILMR